MARAARRHKYRCRRASKAQWRFDVSSDGAGGLGSVDDPVRYRDGVAINIGTPFILFTLILAYRQIINLKIA